MKIGILTLPKSGTHLWSNILKNAMDLGILNRDELSSFYFGHILDEDNLLHLSHDQVNFMTVRDVRGYFLSLCNWCDVRCKQILEEKREIRGMHSERASQWSTMNFEEKLESLVFQTDKSLYDVSYIDSNFQAAGYLVTMGVPVVKFEEIASRDPSSEPSDISIETCTKALGYLGVSISQNDALEILRLSWGDSRTFNPEGGPDKWKKELPEDIKRNIELRYSRHINKLGYEI